MNQNSLLLRVEQFDSKLINCNNKAMIFHNYDFNSMGETDIREEIIAPILRELGYRSGTNNNVIREQQLKYPSLSLGRKKKTDPILKGIADYLCIVDSKIPWTIEAKAPGEHLGNEVIEQAWSYANHPEVRAIFFVITNGKEFKIFQTNRGPDTAPVFACYYVDLEHSFQNIEEILAPQSLLRDFPDYESNLGKPIGQGLRSIVRITNGWIILDNFSINGSPFTIPGVDGMTFSISTGSVERNLENNSLEAYFDTVAPNQALQNLNTKLGLKSLALICNDNELSINTEVRSEFTSTSNHILPAGEEILDFTSGNVIKLDHNMDVNVIVKASGYLQNNLFLGDYKAIYTYKSFGFVIECIGNFEIVLS